MAADCYINDDCSIRVYHSLYGIKEYHVVYFHSAVIIVLEESNHKSNVIKEIYISITEI